MDKEQKDWLIEYLKTTKNLAETGLLIIDREDLLYTILETMHEQTQFIIDNYCITEPSR